VNYVKQFSSINKEDIELVGGKGLSLGRLTQAGLPVPPGFVITTDAYKKFNNRHVDSEFEELVLQAFDALGAERVAVRSSAVAEDSPDASWAGQFESYLNITKDDLMGSIKKCWDSASSEVVNEYAQSKSIGKDQLAIAVVVQGMVESEVSGVAFSVNPVTKDTSEIMIEAIYGLGELLVQGMITPDNYVVNKQSHEITEDNIKTKSKMLVYDNGNNAELPVPEDKQQASCLNDGQISELSSLIVKIEQYYDKPQDVEWALENGQFYIVQSRPITTI
jgi:pyruvate,water dikinase